MGLFGNRNENEAQPLAQRQQLLNRYSSARHNILLVLIFTTINIVLLVANSDSYFLFSAYIPYLVVTYGMLFCGRFPAEYYEDLLDYGFEFLDTGYFVGTLIVAVVICVFYLICWLFSDKNRVGWMITALVLFSIDTLMMVLGGLSIDSALDVLFHGWVIVSLSMGIAAHFKLKKLPDEEPAPEIPNMDIPQV